jgi:hypothetical protein
MSEASSNLTRVTVMLLEQLQDYYLCGKGKGKGKAIPLQAWKCP